MSADTVITALFAVTGCLFAIVLSLVGVIYWMLRAEDKRLARNIHSLRNLVQTIIMTLATRGIRIKGGDSE